MPSPELLRFFQDTTNAGEVTDADARVDVENPVCGDRLVLSARVKDSLIEEVRFLCRGCVAAIGCAAALTSSLQNRRLAEIRRYSRDDLLRDVGGLEPASTHAASLALEARDQLLKTLDMRGR